VQRRLSAACQEGSPVAKPFALQAVLELMQRRADEATQQLASLIAAEQDAKSRLELLNQYRDEYTQRFHASAQAGLTPQQWKNFQDFLGRLDEAIGQQQQVLTQSQKKTAAGQAHWQEQRVRLKAIDTLSVRHARLEEAKENKREQKLVDEFAARQHSRKEV
jgi:flagellar FliJ protein